MKENENLYDLKFKRDEKRGKKIQKRPFTRPESQSSLDSGGMREGTTKLPVLKDVFLKEKPPSKQLVHYLDILSGEVSVKFWCCINLPFIRIPETIQHKKNTKSSTR